MIRFSGTVKFIFDLLLPKGSTNSAFTVKLPVCAASIGYFILHLLIMKSLSMMRYLVALLGCLYCIVPLSEEQF